MKKYGVIMAGGGGTRFWPLSRQKRPKQLLNLSGNDLMINETVNRLGNIIPLKDIFIVTNQNQVATMKQSVVDGVREDHILAEPSARNTAACIGYAAIEIMEKYGDGIMCILPSDHYIKDEQEFSRILQVAIDTAEHKDKLITIGIEPIFPATGYGYIKFDREDGNMVYPVQEFVEKPDLVTAQKYLASGQYAWNSGMFVWKASTILREFQVYLPDIYSYLTEIQKALGTEKEDEIIQRIYPQIPKISIDYGIMERSKEVVVITGDFGWNDVGSWDMMNVLHKEDEHGNVLCSRHAMVDTTGCVLYSDKKLIATVGIKDLVIIDTEDAIMVCPKNQSQDVKLLVDLLEQTGRQEYL